MLLYEASAVHGCRGLWSQTQQMDFYPGLFNFYACFSCVFHTMRGVMTPPVLGCKLNTHQMGILPLTA